MVWCGVAGRDHALYRATATALASRHLRFACHFSLLAGVGEAAVVALLAEKDGEAASTFALLAAGCDVRLSPMPFVATTQERLLLSLGVVGLDGLSPNHLAVARCAANYWRGTFTAPHQGGSYIRD